MSESPATSNGSPEGLLARFMSLLGGKQDDRDKKRLLKAIGRQLRQDASGLLSPKADRVLPGLGKIFYSLYRTLGPAQELLRSADASPALKTIAIEMGMSSGARELVTKLSADALTERYAEVGDQLAVATRLDLQALAKEFPSERVAAINTSSWHLDRLLDLVNFDYYFLLKKLDPALPEQDYTYNPRFQPTAASYLTEDLQDFLEVFMHFDPSVGWDAILDILLAYKGGDVVGRPNFARMVAGLAKLRKNRTLVMVVQLIQDNPFYKPGVTKPDRRSLVEDYLGRLKTQVELTLTQLTRAQKGQQVAKLTHAIFGSEAVARLSHYTEKTNLLFGKRKLTGYTQISQLNYLKAFLLDYCKRNIRLVVDLLLVKGKWVDNTQSKSLSEAYQALVSTVDEITDFDDSMADDGRRGSQLRSILVKCDRTKKYDLARRAISEINHLAKGLVADATQKLLTFGRQLKALVDDSQLPGGQRITNWSEIRAEAASGGDGDGGSPRGDGQLLAVYKRVSAMYRLLELLSGASESDATPA